MDRRARPGRARSDAPLHRFTADTAQSLLGDERRLARSDLARFEAEFGADGALRQPVGESGRVHVDRWLPFLVLHRGDQIRRPAWRARIAIDSPAYLVWSADDDAGGAGGARRDRRIGLPSMSGRLLVDHARRSAGRAVPKTIRRTSRLLSRASAPATREVPGVPPRRSTRRCTTSKSTFAAARSTGCRSQPLLPPQFDQLLDRIAGVERLSLRVPQIHRRRGRRDLSGDRPRPVAAVGRCAAARGVRLPRRRHGESPEPLSRARAQRLSRRGAQGRPQARPGRAKLRFPAVDFADRHGQGVRPLHRRRRAKPPHFHYRPLTVDPDLAKRDLYAIDLRAARRPAARATAGRKAARNRRPADDAGDAQHAGVPAGVDVPLWRRRPGVAGRCAGRSSPRPRTDPPRGEVVGAARDRESRGRALAERIARSIRRSRPRSRSATTSPACWSRAPNC